MTIKLTATFPIAFQPDGVSTSVSADLTEYIRIKGLLPATPTSVIHVDSNITPALVSTSLVGQTVTLTYASVIDGNSFTLTMGF